MSLLVMSIIAFEFPGLQSLTYRAVFFVWVVVASLVVTIVVGVFPPKILPASTAQLALAFAVARLSCPLAAFAACIHAATALEVASSVHVNNPSARRISARRANTLNPSESRDDSGKAVLCGKRRILP